MPKNIKKDTGGSDPAGNEPIAPEWIYDTIMKMIEPDLVSDQIPLLDKKYEGETEEQHQLRMESYQLAFEYFDMVLEQFQTSLTEDVHKWKRAMLEESKAQIAEEEAKEMEEIEKEIESGPISEQ